ncbi:MAG TPA: hypothetical protein PK867_31080, partial [Pirellulales bacterium]|nr:hypothetical protein [Pirellulales bacterium]
AMIAGSPAQSLAKTASDAEATQNQRLPPICPQSTLQTKKGFEACCFKSFCGKPSKTDRPSRAKLGN